MMDTTIYDNHFKIFVSHYAGHLKLTQYCKSIKSQYEYFDSYIIQRNQHR